MSAMTCCSRRTAPTISRRLRPGPTRPRMTRTRSPHTQRNSAARSARSPARSTISAGTSRCKVDRPQAGQRPPGDVPPAKAARRGSTGARLRFAHIACYSVSLPARLRLGARLLEMNLRLDMVHPCKRNEMMLAASIGVGLRELDRIPAFEVIHGSHMHAVGTDDFHIFLDHHWCNHANLLVGI